MRLLTKVTLIILTGAVSTVVVAGFFVYTFTTSTLQAAIQERQEELGRQTMDKIDRLLFNYYVGIQNIGEEEPIERTLGGEVSDVRVIERRIKELPFLTGPWDFLEIVNTSGTVVVSSVQQKVGGGAIEKNTDNLAALREAFSGHVYYSDFLISGETGKPTIIFAAPIRDQEKQNQPIVGAVLGHLAWPVVTQELSAFDPSHEFDLYDKKGILLATNQGVRTALFVKNEKVSTKIQHAFSRNGSVTKLEGEAEEGFRALVTIIPSFGYLAYKGNGWALFIAAPEAVAFTSAKDTAWKIVFLLLPIIFLTAAIKLFLLRKIVIRPISDFTKVTNIIAKGDFSKRAVVASKDEIGELALSFNAMTDKVSDSFGILKAEKDKIETLMESIGDGVMAIEPSGKIMLWNKAAQDISGWSKEEALGKNFHDILKLVRESDKKDNSGFIDVVMKTKTAQAMANHTMLIHKDGGEVSVGDSAAPILDSSGVLQGIIVVFRDVTEERIMDKAKEEFVSLASHQLRTPLTAIKGYTEMLIDQDVGPLNEKQNEYLQDIKIGNNRMIDLVTAFLNVSRIDLGIFTIEPQPINFQEIAEGLFKELGAEIEAKKLHIETIYDKDLPPINADPKLIRIILQNLLTNAIKYTRKEGCISLHIQKPDHHLAITVIDNGYGIPKDVQSKIFTKLFRADNARQKDPNGNGLGLYIVKAIIEASNGKIWFESEENKGTTFYVTFPLEGMKKREGTRMLQ